MIQSLAVPIRKFEIINVNDNIIIIITTTTTTTTIIIIIIIT